MYRFYEDPSYTSLPSLALAGALWKSGNEPKKQEKFDRDLSFEYVITARSTGVYRSLERPTKRSRATLFAEGYLNTPISFVDLSKL